ncbi:MAG TPA: helicase-related protein, partial [Cyclobacteriaceae bacterium]|nr:helicase-related protein [Cyclobacteriaceae bacterium]
EYKIATLFTSSEETTKLIKSDAILVDKKLDGIKDGSREFSVALAILKAIKRYNLHHVIAFTGTIEESIRFQKLLMNVSKVMEQKIDVFHIDGTISEKNRNDILNEYHASPCAIVTNAKLLGEGFDMPAVDAVAFVTDKSSVTDIVQASGRAWRLSEGKEFGYILLPCVLDEEKKPIKQDFLNLRRVVAALSANDEVLYNYFKQSNNNSSNRRGRPIEFENQPLGFDLMKFSESLKLTVWRSLKLIETLNTKIVPWQEAAEFTMSLSIHGITSIKKWDLYNNNHTLFPGAPDKKKGVPRDLRKAYGKDYKPSLFFSKPKARGGWATAKEAAAFTYSLSAHGIINSGTYQWYCRRQNAFPGAPPKPLNIPTKPWLIYGDDYKPELFFSQPSLDRNKNWASAEECARFTSSLAAFGVTNYKKYIRYCKDETMFPGAPKRPTNIPSDPRVVYKEEFRNDKFFPGAISYSTYLPWEEVATFTLSLGKFGVDSHEKWMSYFDDESKFPGAPKRLEGIPKMIRNVYRENYSPSKFFTNGRDVLDIPPWEEVAEFTRSLEKFGIDNYSKWWKYWDDESHFPGAPKRPINYRKNLHTVYGDKFVATIFFTNTRDNKRKGIKFKK